MKKFISKVLGIGVIVLFVGAIVSSSVSGHIKKIGDQTNKEYFYNLPLSTGLLAYWKFDECENGTAYDSSGHGYHGTIYGATCGGGFIVFDGVDDYVGLDEHSENLGLNKTDYYKISVVGIKSESTDNGVIYGMSGSSGNKVYVELELNSEGSFVFRVGTEESTLTVTSAVGFNDGTWHFVDAIYYGNITNPILEIYVDGEIEGILTEWQYPFVNDDFQTAKIGRKSNDSANYFGGVIDDVMVYKSIDGNENTKPEAPTISGEIKGIIGTEYEYTFNATDSDGDPVMYFIDWGDNKTDWTEYCDSGVEIPLKHTWDDKGDYSIKAKAKDIHGAESVWGILEVTIVPIIDIGVITGGLFKVTATIKNLGEINGANMNWSIFFDGGAFIGRETSGTDTISFGEDLIITSNLIVGLGSTIVTVKAEIKDYLNVRKQSGFVFLFFIKVNPVG